MKIHNYRKEKCNWYHNLLILDPSQLEKCSCRGWGDGIEKGDAIIVSLNHYDNWAVYKVASIQYLDSKDAFAAELEIWPDIINEKKEEFEQMVGGKIAIR